MSEQQLKERFAEIAAGVVPAPDPWGRLMRTARRRWRHRFAALGGGLAAIVAVALLGSALPQTGTPTPNPTASHPADWIDGEPISPWTQRLLDSPARGSLAGDQAFLSAFADAAKRRGLGPSELTQVEVLFAGDVGPARIGGVVYRDATDAMVVWFVAKRGAGAAELAAADEQNKDGGYRSISRLYTPLTGTGSLDYRLGDQPFGVTIVPSGCVIATSHDPADRAGGPRWTDSPHGDYLTRLSPTGGYGEWRQVTCDGQVVVREFVDSNDSSFTRPPVTEAELDAALAGARGDVNRDSVRAAINQALTHTADVAGPIHVWFDGTMPGRPDRRWTFMSVPQSDGSFALFTTEVASNEVGAGIAAFYGDAPLMLVREDVEIPEDAASPSPDPGYYGSIFAVVPDGAVRIEVRVGVAAVASAEVRSGVGWIERTRLDQPYTVVALDALGHVVATQPVPLPNPRGPDGVTQVDGWDTRS